MMVATPIPSSPPKVVPSAFTQPPSTNASIASFSKSNAFPGAYTQPPRSPTDRATPTRVIVFRRHQSYAASPTSMYPLTTREMRGSTDSAPRKDSSETQAGVFSPPDRGKACPPEA
jgi:hypothetical protein